jgi:MYXO-CTERM domain-containing protein
MTLNTTLRTLLSPLAPFAVSAALFAAFALPSVAHAGISACGNIHVEASAQCEMRGGVECEASCTPLSFEAQCAAELELGCSGQCNASADVACEADCGASCTGACEVDPGSFDCRASCQGSCEADCEASCGTGDSECSASCAASCSGECTAQCEVVPPSAACDAKCEAACSGECTASANFDCQLACQAEGFAGCKANLEGGCRAECNVEQGALFCDGQYVDHGGNLEECVDALKALFDIEVEGYARAECSGNTCEAEAGGSATISCSVTPEGRDGAGWLLGALALLGWGVARRRAAR